MMNGNEIKFKGTGVEKISIIGMKGFKLNIDVKDVSKSFKVDFKNMVIVHMDKSYEFIGMCINKNDNTELEFIVDLDLESDCEKSFNQHIEEMLETINKTVSKTI